VSKERVIVLSVVQQRLSKAETARRYNVSWRWVHTLVTRYQTCGWEAVEARSRRPHRNSRAVNDELRERICTLRCELQALVRLELMLEDASIKLSSVASSLKTVSARAMLTAMINGESDPLRLADMAKGKMRRKIPDLAQALTGHFDANHARLARSMLRRLDLVEQALVELDQVIVAACRPWQHQIELLQTIPGVGAESRGNNRR
jgi:transposase